MPNHSKTTTAGERTQSTIEKFNALNESQQRALLAYFRDAVHARIAQWNAESAMEGILDCDLDLPIADFAVGSDSRSGLTMDSLRDALQWHEA